MPRRRNITVGKNMPVKVIIKPKIFNDKGARIAKTRKVIVVQKVENDFLKNYRMVRLWISRTYKITPLELETIMFFYSEDIFNIEDWKAYSYSLAYNKRDIKEFINKGIIKEYGKFGGKSGKKMLYTIAIKYKIMCNEVYDVLTGKKEIPKYLSNKQVYQKTNLRSAYYLAKKYQQEKEKKYKESSNKLFNPDTDFLENQDNV